MDHLQSLIGIQTYRDLQCIHCQEADLAGFNTDKTPSRQQAAGIYTQDYFKILLQRERYF